MKREGGRNPPNATESLLWNQRIEKEEYYNARQGPKYSVRNSISVLDVPGKFKPGHIDPSKEDHSLKRYDPAEHGWDPDGEDALEFRRCIKQQNAGPRDREPYPMTAAQEHGWLLGPGGDHLDRVRRKKCRMGIGWECKHPSDYSASTAMPPPVLVGQGERSSGVPAQECRSCVSAAAPVSVLSNSPPSLLSCAAASAISAVSHSSSSTLSRATSLPAIGSHPADVLCRRERKVDEAMAEESRYQVRGDRGHRYARPLGTTDATKFDDDFCKAAGIPLYKAAGNFVPTLKYNGHAAPKWK